MVKKMVYHTPEKVVEYNLLALTLIGVKKADKSELLSRAKLIDVLNGCKKIKGVVYDKAAFLFKELIQQHPFASGNRRTAFIVTKDFVLKNNGKFCIKDDPKQAKVLTGIRERVFILLMELKHGLKMAKLESSKDKKVYQVVLQELEHFNKLIKGHKKLLVAIGEL